jgi:protein-tyrosine phosphatase
MIDIHAHILPGIDDGASDFDEAVQMLELAREAGTTAIVATPHADLRYRFDAARSKDLLEALTERCPAGPRLYSGSEVHLTPENMVDVLRRPAAYTLNGGDCILLELPDRLVPSMVDPAIDAFSDAGLRTIIAHPERNPYLQQNFSYAERLVDRGCYLQLTARSLSGGFGPASADAASQLLSRRLAHFVASDAHGAIRRKPGLSIAFATVAEAYGMHAAHTLLVANPEAALECRPIQRLPAAPKWFSSLFSRSTHVQRITTHV